MSREKTASGLLSFSPVRLVLLVAAIVAAGSVFYFQRIGVEKRRLLQAENEAVETIMRSIKPTPATLNESFTDNDGNLVADTPADESARSVPETLRFAYLSSAPVSSQSQTWQALTDALADSTGLRVEFAVYPSTDEQLAALRDGSLHVTAFNTGSVTTAVNQCGFVPVSGLSTAAGETGYACMIISHRSRKLESLDQMKSLLFTSPRSNSGFRYPVLVLAKNFSMLPERDYAFQFSQSHEDSIRRVIENQVEAAAVASDVLQLIVEDNQVNIEDIKILYESSQFPAACFGFHHSLEPELAKKITQLLESFRFTDEQLSEQFRGSGFTRLAPIDFKEDFSEIRLIEAVLSGKELLGI